MRKIAIALAATAALATNPAFAGQTTTTMPVTATVFNNCTVSATSMSFGSLANLGVSNHDASATISLACTPNAAYDVGLDFGSNAAGGVRQLVNSTDSTQVVPYAIYRDSARSVAWGNSFGTDTVTGFATGGSASLTAFGRIPTTASAVTAGSYADTVTVTVNF